MTYYPAGHLLCIQQMNFEHVGISDGSGFVYENSYARNGKGRVSLEQFADGCEIIDLGPMPGSLPPAEVIQRAEAILDRPDPYHILNNNCEHFVREICGLSVLSPQILKSWLFVLLAATILKTTGMILVPVIVWLAGWAYGVRRWPLFDRVTGWLSQQQFLGRVRTGIRKYVTVRIDE